MNQTMKDLAKAYVAIEKQQVAASKMVETFDQMKMNIVKAASEIGDTGILFKEISNEYRGN